MKIHRALQYLFQVEGEYHVHALHALHGSDMHGFQFLWFFKIIPAPKTMLQIQLPHTLIVISQSTNFAASSLVHISLYK